MWLEDLFGRNGFQFIGTATGTGLHLLTSCERNWMLKDVSFRSDLGILEHKGNMPVHQ